MVLNINKANRGELELSIEVEESQKEEGVVWVELKIEEIKKEGGQINKKIKELVEDTEGWIDWREDYIFLFECLLSEEEIPSPGDDRDKNKVEIGFVELMNDLIEWDKDKKYYFMKQGCREKVIKKILAYKKQKVSEEAFVEEIKKSKEFNESINEVIEE